MNQVRGTSLVADLGLITVAEVERFMEKAAILRRNGEIPDLLLFMAHPPTVSLGLRDDLSNPKDLLVSRDRLQEEGILLTRSIRGGGATYHWPGQVVCYPILALPPSERNIPDFMYRLEEVALQALSRFHLHPKRRRDAAAFVGLWLDNRKLVSTGIRVSRWVTMFGFAVNVAGEHQASSYVRPCGIEGARLVSMEEVLGTAPERAKVIEAITDAFQEVFRGTLGPAPDDLIGMIASRVGTADCPKQIQSACI
jgi:lipoate-protein ligase B